MSYRERLQRPGPKRLLAIDGGGIRGLIAIEILARLEALLRERLRAGERFVLSDYFDYVAGTSTGAIVATFIAKGFPMARIREFYLEGGRRMFQRAPLLQRWRYRNVAGEISARLREVLGATTEFGDPTLRTLLLLVMRNATTDSPWPLSNNPHATFNDPAREDCNLRLPLWQLVRASTAAPTYFPPEVIEVGGREFVFVDGGITVYNNPAFLVYLMATLAPYRLGWPAGEENLLLVSVGTGSRDSGRASLRPSEMTLLYHARAVPAALLYAAQVEQDMLCRVLGRCAFGAPLDAEVGDLRDETAAPKQFRYARYDPSLTAAGLTALGLERLPPRHVQPLDGVDHLDELRLVGERYAQCVSLDHFGSHVPAGAMPADPRADG